jgi:hypothetical protein
MGARPWANSSATATDTDRALAPGGRQGEAIICSVSFVLPPLTKERMQTLDDQMPRAPTEAMSYVLTMLVVPNLMIHTATNPGQPLVQRLTYKVNKTVDDRVIVDITDFPGFRRREVYGFERR